MLPFINKLKIGDIEIEVESAGARPVAPTSITGGISATELPNIKEPLFFPRFWY